MLPYPDRSQWILRLELESLRHLRELRADGNLIRSLDGLQRMDCLVKLSLQRNHIVDLGFTQGSWCAFLPFVLGEYPTKLPFHIPVVTSMSPALSPFVFGSPRVALFHS
jgi:hypothetical protein